MKKNVFSVIIPVYNSAKYLERCINSIISQTYTDWEIILVDDGSKDESGYICDLFSKKDSRIFAFHKENEGVLSARQFGWKRATGDYLVFVDSDDFLMPNALEIISDTIISNNSDCVIYALIHYVNNSFVTCDDKVDFCNYSVSDKRLLYKKVFQNTTYNSMCCKAIKYEYVIDKDYSEYFHIHYGEDLLQSIDIYKNCNRITFIPNKLYIYCSNPKSATHRKQKKEFITDFKVRDLLLNFLKNENLFSKEDFQEYRKFCLWQLKWILEDIGQSSIPINEKIILFKEIKSNKYYTDFLCGNDMEYYICSLLRDNNYFILIFIAYYCKFIKKVKSRVLRFLYK